MKKPIYKRRWFIVLTVFIFMGVATYETKVCNIAKFDHAIDGYIVGEEKTITGEPGVRGMNTDKRKMWWKL